jgi:large subunit ribosomal protein L25
MQQSPQPSQQSFTAFAREIEGRGASRRLRQTGRAPGIVYGGADKPQTIALDHNALIYALKREAFHSTILTMTLGETTQRVLLREVQMHPFRHEVLHIDFQRVDENRKIRMKVPLHFANSENSPAASTDAIISHVLTELEVSCLPKDLPAFIEVDLSTLAVGQSIHVSDLTLPPGVTAVTRGGESPVVATAIVPRVIAEVEEVAAVAEPGAVVEGAPLEAGKAGEKAPEKGTEKGAEKGSEKSAEKAPAKKDDKK